MYSGHARDKLPGERESGDQWAWIGRTSSRDHTVNPMTPGFGSHPFGVETGGDADRIVTDHSPLVSDGGTEAGYLDRGTESLANTARAITSDTAEITRYAPLGPTNYQKGVLSGLEQGAHVR
ncbi:RNA polymerase, sigma factor [Leifsonia xyli subsp. cynodontis DSM 46306]|uniref:Uncharacterized protein n=1 Tax=Leifsonia xyli subsp. cynodontis DSM 46306 TaxID=1389489 RepID=U3PAZ3_LEIXC|nr:hypothetical protein [Leifsonia xyli]AGW42724.1 RNA polymerase, sigma factor [Leifsonia xyli subsp. cynodontis DSM 46306]